MTFFCPHLPFTTFLIPFLVSGLRTHSPLGFLFCRLSLPSGDPYLCCVQLSHSVSFAISWDSFLFHSCSHMFSSTVCWRGCLLCNTCFGNFENIDIFSCLNFWCFCSSPLIYTSVFVLIPLSLLLWLSRTIEIRYCNSFSTVLYAYNCCDSLGSFVIPYEF